MLLQYDSTNSLASFAVTSIPLVSTGLIALYGYLIRSRFRWVLPEEGLRGSTGAGRVLNVCVLDFEVPCDLWKKLSATSLSVPTIMDTRGSNGYRQELQRHGSRAIRSGDSTCKHAFFGPCSTRGHVANLCQALDPQRHLVDSSKSDLELGKRIEQKLVCSVDFGDRWVVLRNGALSYTLGRPEESFSGGLAIKQGA